MIFKTHQNNYGQKFYISVCIIKLTPNERDRFFSFFPYTKYIFLMKRYFTAQSLQCFRLVLNIISPFKTSVS